MFFKIAQKSANTLATLDRLFDTKKFHKLPNLVTLSSYTALSETLKVFYRIGHRSKKFQRVFKTKVMESALANFHSKMTALFTF